MQRTRPAPALKNLKLLIGKWKTEGTTKAGIFVRIKCIDTYEWMEGSFFILHRVDGKIGKQKIKVLEMIGYDASKKTCIAYSFDNHGKVGIYKIGLQKNNLKIKGRSERFKGIFSENRNKLSGTWELLEGGSDWKPWMDVTLTKLKGK